VESDSLPPSEFLNDFFGFVLLQINNIDVYTIVIIIAIFLLFILSALISGSEVAFYSISPSQIVDLRESEDKKDKTILELLEKPRLLLATILISNNFVNISIIILFNYLMNTQFEAILSSQMIVIINVVVLTFLLVFFGEVSPKVFANQNNLIIARFTAKFFKILRVITFPIGYLLVKSGLFLEKKFENLNHEIDLDEIEKAIDLSTNDGSTKEDVEMLKGIVHFGNTTVKQIMTPRVDIDAVKHDLTFKDIMAKVKDARYSRMPVYNENIDKIEGILYLKDLLEHLDESEDYHWQELIREGFFVPETKKIDDLLREIQENRKHQAIVVDEYGGTMGLVTLEDILEEVLGEIKDEFDEDLQASFKKINDNSYIFDGKIMLEDLCEVLGIAENTFDEIRGESDTIAGVILELAGEFPAKGASINYENYTFIVLSMEKNRIKKIKLTINEE